MACEACELRVATRVDDCSLWQAVRLSSDADVDILLVPVHPQTGQTWTPASPTASAHLVPLPLGVWLWLVSPWPYLPVPASGRIPQDVLRDEPLPPRPNYLFRADRGTFQHTLVRLPAVRSPLLRTILEQLTQGRLGRTLLAACNRTVPDSPASQIG